MPGTGHRSLTTEGTYFFRFAAFLPDLRAALRAGFFAFAFFLAAFFLAAFFAGYRGLTRDAYRWARLQGWTNLDPTAGLTLRTIR